ASLEPDARLTAMWLWTVNSTLKQDPEQQELNEDPEDDDAGQRPSKTSGFTLEYDAARKIAQGLGADLDSLNAILEVTGETARLLTVSKRTRYLLEKDPPPSTGSERKKKLPQTDSLAQLMGLPESSPEAQAVWDKPLSSLGKTTLDHVHQSMIL